MNGILVTGPNGGTVFPPAAVYRWLVDLDGEGELGFYWSSSLDPIDEIYAFGLGFRSDYWGWDLK